MNYSIEMLGVFERQLKHLVKKYPSLKSDLRHLIDTLEKEPEQGTALGKGCFKIRLAITSKGKGKSGGARVITCVKIINETVYLLAIYDKSETDTISNSELEGFISLIK